MTFKRNNNYCFCNSTQKTTDLKTMFSSLSLASDSRHRDVVFTSLVRTALASAFVAVLFAQAARFVVWCMIARFQAHEELLFAMCAGVGVNFGVQFESCRRHRQHYHRCQHKDCLLCNRKYPMNLLNEEN